MSIPTAVHFVRSPRGRLTFTYLAIIMVMSIGFSVVLYYTASYHLFRLQPPSSLYGSEPHIAELRPTVENFIHQRIVQGRHALIIKMVVLNVLTLIAGTIFSYLLARRTLRPVEEAIEAQNQFIGDASHELRTPLTAIKTSNEVAMRKQKLTAEETRQLFKTNVEYISRLEVLTNNLLRLITDQPISGQTITPVLIQDAAAQAMTQVTASAQAKDIEVDDKLDNTTVQSDAQIVSQIVAILLDNAIKYSDPHKSITLDDSVKGKYVYIRVRDQGIGITPEDIPHIFKRFYRVDQARTRGTSNGYGLGLSIADKLCKQIHGKLLVDSEVGAGSTFTLVLPVVTPLSKS